MSIPVQTRRASFAIMHPRLLTHDEGDEERTHARIVLARACEFSILPLFPPTS